MEIVKINIGRKDDFPYDGIDFSYLYPKTIKMYNFPSLRTPPPNPVPKDSIQFVEGSYPEVLKPIVNARIIKYGNCQYNNKR